MTRYSRKKYSWYVYKNVGQKYIVPSLVIGLTLLAYSKDAWYFDNGQGGIDWQIGKPLVNAVTANTSVSLPKIRQQALELVNRDRQMNGLPPLVEDPLLAVAAQAHAEDMLKRRYYDHISPEGKTPTDRFREVGGRQGVGENIMQQTSNQGVRLTYGLIEHFQKGWMYSPGHRENLLTADYTHFGYGIIVDPLLGEVYAVQNFY